jgi:transposase
MDMGPAYVKGATEHFPDARIVFDKFHVMVLAGKALDEVRRELQREGADLKGAMWSLRGNAWNLSQERQEQRKNLCRRIKVRVICSRPYRSCYSQLCARRRLTH